MSYNSLYIHIEDFDKLINFVIAYLLTNIRELKNEKSNVRYSKSKAYIHNSFRDHRAGFFYIDEYARVLHNLQMLQTHAEII
jgi:hypothetical protein